MATPEHRTAPITAAEPGRACFLCAFAEHPCHVTQVDGTLRGVVERWRGGNSPVLLVADHDQPVAILLDRRDRDLARSLAALPVDQLRALRVRAFHLHRTPEQAAAAAVPDAVPPPRYRTLRASAASVIVLEPDLLLNITDINNAERCVRQYVLRRMIPSPPNAATLRGTIVHGAFKELLKGRADDLPAVLTQALRTQTTEMAVQQVPMADVAADAEPHLAALATWYTRQRQHLWTSTPRIRVETFVLAPLVGLKGRLDALWEDEHTNHLLELKTSTVRGDLPRHEHRWQVYGYQTLLASRGHGDDGRPAAATLLYSGTAGQAEAYTLPFSLRELQRVLELRNLLAIAHTTGVVPPPPGERTCGRCLVRAECAQVAPMLGWEPPLLDEQAQPLNPRDVAWFRHYYELLALEGQAAEAQGHLLWTTTPAERCSAGSAIGNLEASGPPQQTASGEWEYVFHCENASELREGDPILLSDGDPIYGAAVTGTLLSVSDRTVVVWTPERIARPTLIDRYGSDIVHDRTVRNLWRWLAVDPHLRASVRGEVAPTFANSDVPISPIPDFNPEQATAVRQALAARDFLLIQGPPGTGKTRVVSEIVRQSVARGERVLIAAFTNQAVDNVLTRLVADGFHDVIRLGHELSVAPDLRGYRLAPRAAALAGREAESATDNAAAPEELRAALMGAPVVASTTATWAAERYDGGGPALAFDLAIVDEASQLTVPALVGALRFARRFVLVGDGQQLPPLVTSAIAAERGLKESLFASLLARWGDAGSVRLTRQYRMHPTICAFPSQAFYEDALTAEGEARSARLALHAGPPDGLDALLDPLLPVVFVDVPSSGTHVRGSEKVSQAQAQIAQRVVLGLRARGVPPAHIGVIAPYRAQVAAIRQRLASSGEGEITVDTVDRFQGAEREVIVLSFGLESAPPAGSTGAAFLADPHRLNVALTRAQRKLILLGNQRTLKEVPLLAQLLAHCAALYGGRGGLVRAHVGTRS